MAFLVIAMHIFVCLFLIFIVLVQGGKGAQMGAAFGGSSQTLFGGRGAATFLGKMTTAVAALFMVTSLLLTLLAFRGSGTVVKQPAPEQSAPAAGQPTESQFPPAQQAPGQKPAVPQEIPSAP